MNWEALFNAIRTRFKIEVEDYVNVPIQYDNVALTPPQNSPWMRFSIVPGDSFQKTLGDQNRRFRTVGTAIAQVFIPLAMGDRAGLEIADAVRDAFRAVSVDGVVFQTPSITVLGRDEGHWQINVSCPWYADDIA